MSHCDIDYVCIVDDDATSAAFFSTVVQEAFAPRRIDTAGTLGDARSLLLGDAATAPDLLLLDLHLPDGAGIDMLAPIRAKSPDTMVVVITIFDDDESLFGAMRRGVDGYLIKAETRAGATSKLLGILRGEPPLSARVARRILRHLESPPESPAEPHLTGREQEILQLLARGQTIAQAAQALEVSPHPVQHHVRNLYRKLDVHSRAGMTRVAVDRGLV